MTSQGSVQPLQAGAGVLHVPGLSSGSRSRSKASYAHVVIDDRAAIEALLADQLEDPLPRHPRIGLQRPVDLVLKRSSFEPAGARSYLGAVVERSAERIVLHDIPLRCASSLIDTPRTKCFAPQLGPTPLLQQDPQFSPGADSR
jgi:hypothetical protein